MDISGRSAEIRAIIDSGNLLKDPITNASVIVVEKNKLESLISKDILDNLEQILMGKYEIMNNNEYLTKFRIIPFSSIGKQNGMLLGFKPDFVEVEIDNISKQIENVIIGIYEKSITKNQSYAGLVGLDILEEGK